MNDDLAARFDGIDGPRPLPDDARRRIEALLASDAPRPLPNEFRDRLESSLVAGIGVRPLPHGLRRRARRTMTASAPAARLRVAGLVAAAVLTLLGSMALVSRTSDPAHDRATSLATGDQNVNGAARGDASAPESADSLSSGGPGATVAGGASAGAASAGSTASGRAAPVAQRIPVAVIGGDAEEEAGFRAYVDARRPPFDLVAGDAAAVVEVNLSPEPSGARADRVVMEGSAAIDASLRGNVFDVAGTAERQAHIAAGAAFPRTGDGRAVIVTGGAEPFASIVPTAFEAALHGRGVTTVRVPYRGSSHPVLPAADATFLSLPSDLVRPWLHAARDAGYAPDHGIWGIFSAADDALAADAPASLRVVSPFAFPASSEADKLRAATGHPLSARSIHGWLTAKYLATALARSGASTTGELATALGALGGFDDGFAPPYEVRAGTRSRTPEGVVLAVTNGRWVATNGFVRDDL